MPSKPSRARTKARPAPVTFEHTSLQRRTREPEMLRVIAAVPSLAYLANAFDPPICKQAVSRWDRVPVDRVREVSAITNIPTWEIRPDIFDPPIIIRGSGDGRRRRIA